jgi:predicted DNA-binding transcriptional regulator AlpA
MNDKLKSPVELAEALNIKAATLAEWRAKGLGPAFHKIGRSVRYAQHDIEAWLQKNRRTGTGQHG